jgi:hypothetical protein
LVLDVHVHVGMVGFELLVRRRDDLRPPRLGVHLEPDGELGRLRPVAARTGGRRDDPERSDQGGRHESS